jgi:Tol biopolymer transport system component
LTAQDRTPRPFLTSPADEAAPAFSPDGRWLAYVSNESGRNEVYLTLRSGTERARRISTDGGSEPVWAPDGRELFYREGRRMMGVAIDKAERGIGRPQIVFEGDFARGTIDAPNYDAMADGRFVMIQRSLQNSAPETLHVLLNWSRGLGGASLR